jgi:hypothetical protein
VKWDGTYVVRVAEELPSYGIAIPLDDLVVIIGLVPVSICTIMLGRKEDHDGPGR